MVELPNKITEISDHFYNICSNLQKEFFLLVKNMPKINIPESVTEIGEFSFFDYSSLSEIALSKSMKAISCAFYRCVKFEKVIMPKKCS